MGGGEGVIHAPTFLSLFAGIGGFDLALERAGFRCVGQIENDPLCTRVLAARFPGVHRLGDVRKFQLAERWGRSVRSDEGGSTSTPGKSSSGGIVELLVGGFPCQDFSVAGRRAGLVGYQGTLFWEIVRIAKEIKPTWGLFENVPGLLSSRGGRDFWAVLQGLRECWPAVGWRVLDSRYFGVPQRRRRVFFVCGPSEAAVASVLFESEGGGRHPPAGKEAGADVAHTLARGSHGSGTRLDPNGEDFIVTATLNSGGNQGGFRTEPGEHLVVHALSSEGADASEDGPGAVGFAQNQRGATVRRLTPMECERLQAFPDGWTCLCRPIKNYAANPEQTAWDCRCPDGTRYRSLGNAVTVSVVEWLERRLLMALAAWEEGKA